VGLGLLSGRAAPPFLFSWGGAPARVIGRRAGVWRVWLVACGLRPPGRPGARDRAGFWVRERGWVRLGAGARPSAWWGGAGECGRAFVCVRAGRGARVIGRGMVYAYLAGRGPTKTRCGWLCVSCWSHPVFGDSLCGF
jgi:hypothetical protein